MSALCATQVKGAGENGQAITIVHDKPCFAQALHYTEGVIARWHDNGTMRGRFRPISSSRAMHHLVMIFLGSSSPTLPRAISQAVKECRCTMVNGYMSTMGREFIGVLFLSGTWDAIAKMEDSCGRLEEEHTLQCLTRRTEPHDFAEDMLPYAVDAVFTEQAGVVHDLFDFFIRSGLQILDLHVGSFRAQHTGVAMSSLHMSVGLPLPLSIAVVRGEFAELCDRLNIDAVMEPVK